MSEEAINPLRRRMIEDMRARNLDEATQRGYLRSVRACCRYCGRGPGQLTFEERLARLLGRMEHVPALGRFAVARQLGIAGHAPYVARHAVPLGQNVLRP